ncbi:MAG: hypothetical protein ACOZBH_05385 [Patescibacteria group bacterium]
MALKIIKIILFILAVYLLSSPFMSGLFYPLNMLNLYLLVMVFLLMLYDIKTTLIFSVVFSFLSAPFTSLPFFVHIFILPVSMMILSKIYMRFFTNKSVYSILLMNIILTAIFGALSTGAFLAYYLYVNKTMAGAINYQLFLSGYAWHTIITSALAVIFFILINRLSNRLKAIFIDASKQSDIFRNYGRQ